MKNNKTEEKTYLVKRRGEELKVTVPASWKVTYAPIQPGAHGEPCLRFYESDKQQRAIFTDVQSFMDTSINVSKLITTTKSVEEVKQDEWDLYERKGETLIQKTWVALEA